MSVRQSYNSHFMWFCLCSRFELYSITQPRCAQSANFFIFKLNFSLTHKSLYLLNHVKSWYLITSSLQVSSYQNSQRSPPLNCMSCFQPPSLSHPHSRQCSADMLATLHTPVGLSRPRHVQTNIMNVGKDSRVPYQLTNNVEAIKLSATATPTQSPRQSTQKGFSMEITGYWP